jgi:hypothetical protein
MSFFTHAKDKLEDQDFTAIKETLSDKALYIKATTSKVLEISLEEDTTSIQKEPV